MNIVNQQAYEVHRLAHILAQGYYAYQAAMTIALDSRSDALIPDVIPGHRVPVGFVSSKDGINHHTFHFKFYLDLARKDLMILDELKKVWLTGALLHLGNSLSIHNYFDRAPLLELVRHLRNGVAHGNRFNILNPKSLLKHPAHNYDDEFRDKNLIFEITPILHNTPVLFDFIGAGDILTLLQDVSLHLSQIAQGIIIL